MEAKAKGLMELIGNKDNIFSIPHYQRNYNWSTKKQVKELINDLFTFYDYHQNEEFFLGTIIVKKNSEITSEHILVDGQQRVTTFLLMISALKKTVILEGQFFYTLKNLLDTIDEKKFKLKRIKDHRIVQLILKDKIEILTDEEKKSNYCKVYEYLLERINKKFGTDEEKASFYDKTLNRVQIALINLNAREDENLIFESINSKGETLSSADLIKNYTMMKLGDDKSMLSKFEENFLNKFSNKPKINESYLLDFYRQMIAIETGKLESKKGKSLYLSYKNILERYTNENGLLGEKYINYILSESMIYHYICDENFSSNFKNKNVFYPLIKSNLANFYCIIHALLWRNSKFYNNEIVITNQENILKGLKYLSALSVARIIVNYGRVEGNRTYAKMGYDLKLKFKDDNNLSFDEIFNDNIIKKLNTATSNYRMPSIVDIKNIESKQDLYSNHKLTLKWIFIALEENITKKELNYNEIEIEHILPQDRKKWILSNNIEEMEEWINSLGNLSILDKIDNIKGSNNIFKYKKDIFNNFSYYKINNILNNYEEWNLVNLKDRAKNIIEDIERIWFEDSYFK